MTFLIAWLGGKVGKLWAEAIVWLLIAAAIASPFVFTYYQGKSNCENAVAQQALQARVATLATLATLNQAGQVAVGDYVLRRAQTITVVQTINQEVPRATQLWKPAQNAAAVPLPACVFTRGFVGLWNSALEAGHDPAGLSAAAGRVAGAAASTAPVADADLLDSGLARADMLTNHIANASALSACQQWHDAVLDWDKRTYGPAP